MSIRRGFNSAFDFLNRCKSIGIAWPLNGVLLYLMEIFAKHSALSAGEKIYKIIKELKNFQEFIFVLATSYKNKQYLL